MKRELFFIFIAMLVIKPLFGASLEDLLGAERAAAVRAATEPVTEVQTRAPSPRLLPRHGELERFVAEVQKSLEPNMLVEALYVYRKPAGVVWDVSRQAALLNQLVGLSTLAGIQYYSESRKEMRTFYESSSVIDNPTAKRPLPDPVYSGIPASLVLYARQKDLTFGDNIYRYDYSTSADAIFFVQENITSMNAGIIPAIGKNKLRSVMAVIDAGDSLLLYTAAMVKAASIPGMGDRIGSSFTNRAKAIIKWFEERAGK